MDGGFFAELPVWTIVSVRAFKQHGLLPSLPKMVSPTVGVFLPIFTDDDLAESFIERSKLNGMAALALATPRAIRTVLTELESKGCSHVSFDLSIFSEQNLGRFYPIREVIEAVPGDNRQQK